MLGDDLKDTAYAVWTVQVGILLDTAYLDLILPAPWPRFIV